MDQPEVILPAAGAACLKVMNSTTTVYTTSDLAQRVAGELRGRGDIQIVGVNSMDEATAEEITFIADTSHAGRWREVAAGAAVVSEGLEPSDGDRHAQALIFVPDAELAMIELLRLFEPSEPLPQIGVHPSAVVHPSATIGRGARIGPHVSIDEQANIGDRAVLHAGVRIYGTVQIGDDAVLHANTVVRERCRIGRRVILHQNVSIGADGFGYRPSPDGSGLLKVPQIGTAVIEDDVEIGANSCVDRGKFGTTVIGAGTKIDNLVQIGHNCRIGRDCVIAGLAGLSGSVIVGDGVRIGGAVGISEHVRIGDRATIAAQSGVMRDIPAGDTYLGSPADEVQQKLRQFASIRKLPDWMHRVSQLLKVEHL
ncbi:MAG: UDP-3-O-(3-hydroxymyristoyl)glucosamine N-acyltransferase [Planctomycetota bacterium]|nr:UDP-3-O-(3-hydroxymyristoyl)glucosamine N-acyltransferase [Planctomycetota bacterium]